MPGKYEHTRAAAGNPSGHRPSAAPAADPRRPRRRRRRRHRRLNPLFLVTCAVLLGLLVLLFSRCGKADEPQVPVNDQPAESESFTTEPPLEVIASASISVQGDLLMHRPVMNTCLVDDNSYDFSSIFRYLPPVLSGYDYNIANLETTLGGPDYPYQGNPNFNAPDALADSAAQTGFHMLLTANNHCADTSTDGIFRTIRQLQQRGLTPLGTQLSGSEPKYEIVEINGIRIGMVCYTYATTVQNGLPGFNFIASVTEQGVVNFFSYDALDKFYTEFDAIVKEMEAAGADATMAFMHWGTEYETTENDVQRAIAQRLCDMGIDVIVGGHPHVVQPMDLLTSTADPSHKTVCIYSLGNAISNQRIAEMNLKTGHTEDGALFSVTFDMYSDGSVYVSAADVVPTWVNYHANNGYNEYNILPLRYEQRDNWQTMFSLNDDQLLCARNSYERTMAILETGLLECREYLAQARADREG